MYFIFIKLLDSFVIKHVNLHMLNWMMPILKLHFWMFLLTCFPQLKD